MSRVLVAIAAAALAIVVVGAAWRTIDDRSAPPIVIADPLADAVVAVSVEGAVASPGVVELPATARHADAVAAAGGLADDADLSAFNPARRVRDEERIVVPSRAPTASASSATGVPASAPSSASSNPPGLVDINTAGVEDLDALPGIGPVLAERIVSAREERGPFASLDDLASVEGISRRMVEDLRPLATAGP